MNINQRKTRQELYSENEELRAQLTDIEEILRAIRCGEVDALFVADTAGERVLTLEGAESAYRVLVEAMSEGAAILKDRGVLLYCNGRLATMLMARLETVIGTSLLRFVAPSDQGTVEMLLERAQTETCSGDITLCSADGITTPVQLSLSPMQIHGLPSICAIATDLTERNRVEKELRSLALVDELTGLFNRRGFLTLAQQEMKLAQRLKGDLLLVFADLDGMKHINDSLGHHEGDQALTDAAVILKETYRESDIIARLGGDEFAVLAMANLEKDTESLARRLQYQLDAHNARGHRPYQLSMSVGIVRYDPKVPIPIGDLLTSADAAMYEQKRRKRENATVDTSLLS